MQLTLYDKNGREKARFSPSDSSTQTKEIQGDNVLGLSFTLYEFVAIDVNDYIDYEGERYRALEKYKPSEKSTVEWEYSVQFYGVESLIKRFLVLNTTDGDNEAVFTLTDKPSVHLALIVRCINEGMASMGTARWVAGAIANDLNAENVVIDYHGKYCDEALRELAEAVGSEWYVEGTTVSIGRCEFGEPLTLGYGEGKGLTSLDRDRADNAKFYTRLFPIGSSRNIDPATYGHSRLQLPGGAKFVDVNTDEYGIIHHYEQEAFAGIYPRRIGEVASVRSVQATSDDGTPYTIYHFKDNGLDFNPDEYMMAGKVLRVSFQDGEMAGLGESDDHYFEVNWHNDTREFEIITIWPYGNDTQLPGGNLIPKRGDHYILWNCRMPQEYYGYAEAEFLDAVNAYNADHALDVSRYKGPTDHVWVEQKEAEAAAQGTGPVFYLGRRVRLESSEYFPDTGHRQSRITKITRKVTLPSQMDLEISNALSRTSLEKIGDDIGEARNYAATLFRGIAAPDLIRVGDGTKPTDNNLYSARRSHEEFLSKKSNDTAQGFIQFLAGIGIGPAETWGYVKKVTENGVEKVKSWFKNLWTDVLTVSAYIKGENGTVNIESNLYGTGSAEFEGDLYAEGGIHSGGDVVADNNICGVDGSFSRDVDVKGTVTTQNLKVTGIAEFFKLIIDELRAAGGAQLYTAADGFAVEAVTRFEYDGGHRRRLWWRATDGTKATQSKWVQGMQAVCMNFNAVTAPGQYDNVSNHQFWAVVAWCYTEKNTTPTWDNTNPEYVKAKAALPDTNAVPPNPYEVTDWHYIDLYCGATADAVDNSTSDEKRRLWKGDIYNVAVGDEIAMLGYRPKASDYVGGKLTEDARRLQSAVYVSAYSSYDDGLKAPFLAFYQGIDDFDLSSHRKTYIDAFGSKFYGDFYAESGGEGLAGLLSTLEVGLNGVKSEVSSLPISRNLLLNTEFMDIDDSGLPKKWETWNVSGNAMSRDFFDSGLGKWRYMWLSSNYQYQGVLQDSSVLTGGKWEKVLKHGHTYTLSFYAARSPMWNGGPYYPGAIVQIYNVHRDSVSIAHQAYESNFQPLTTDWQRYSITFTAGDGAAQPDPDGYAFRVMLGFDIGTAPQRMWIARPQLEEGDTATEWRRGEENTALMQTQFKQLSDRMELGVYRDGVKRSGMTLDEDGVEFDGDRVKINGDLDLQGLTTENVHIAENIEVSIRPTVINMGIGATGNEVVKSVFVKPNNETPQTLVIRDPLNQTNGIDAVSCKVVVLPLWGSDFENWNSAITFNTGTGADDPLRGSFMLTRSRLYNGESMPDVARRVVPWRKSGTRVTVSNAAAESTMNWQSLMTEPIWNDDIETWSQNEPANNTTYYTRTRLSNIISHVRQLLGRAVLVCADPRILAYENIEANFPFTGMEDETIMHKAGCFSCAGWRSRFIILLPGQTLQLRSQITTSSTGSEVLTWVVENTEEFTPLSMTLSIAHGEFADLININYLGDAVYYPFNGGHAVLDTIVGHPLLKHVRKTFQAQAGVSQVFYTGGIELDFNIETN